MTSVRRGLAALSLLALFAAPALAQDDAPRLRPGEPIPAAELEAFVDGVVAAAMAEHHIVGVTVSAVQNGEVVLAKGYGFADLETGRRVDPDATLFRVGSITKTFTWIEIMRLAEAGRLSLDDPVNDHLPPELQIPDQGYDAPIRVRDLMTHQPGFEDRTLGILFADDPANIRPLTEFLRDTRPNRVRPPGELSSYSNYGAALAGAIVEHETGRMWQDVVEDDILTPLGMTHTSPREPYPAREGLPAPMPEALAEDAAIGYRAAGASAQAQDYEYITQIAPAGAISSTAADMARYMLMQLGEGELDRARIYGAEAARAFRTPMTSLPRAAGSWDGGFLDTPSPEGARVYGHDGGTLTFFSNMGVAPELGFGLFVSTNTAGGGALSGALGRAVVEHFYGPPKTAPLPGAPEQRAAMAAYAGQYRSTRRRYGGLEGVAGRLQAIPVTASPDGYLTIAVGPAPQRFVPTDTPDQFRNAEGPGLIVLERRGGRLMLMTVALGLEKLGPLSQPTTLLLLAGLTALAALAAVVGLVVRAGRGLPKTPLQARAGQLQIAAAVVWLASLASAGAIAASVSDPTSLVYDWPTPPVLAFSSLALVASLASAGVLALLPAVWTGGGGWSAWRKTRFSMTAAIFAALALLLASWGALQPWNP